MINATSHLQFAIKFLSRRTIKKEKTYKNNQKLHEGFQLTLLLTLFENLLFDQVFLSTIILKQIYVTVYEQMT